MALLSRRVERRRRLPFLKRGHREGVGEAISVLLFQGGRNVVQIVALVAPGGKVDPLDSALHALQVTQPDAEHQGVHLAPDIVHVVLALHVESDRVEKVGEHRAVGGIASVAHVQRPGGVGRDELHLDSASRAPLRTSVRLALRRDLAHHALQGSGGKAEVDEAGSRDLDLADS